MTIEGQIINGQVVLNVQVPVPDGTRVRVELLKDAKTENAKQTEKELPSLYERMKSFVGSVEGLPSDYAINHDHYLHGQPKRQ